MKIHLRPHHPAQMYLDTS